METSGDKIAAAWYKWQPSRDLTFLRVGEIR